MLDSFKPSPSFRELSAAGEKEFPGFSTGNGCPGSISPADNQLQLLSILSVPTRDSAATSQLFQPVHPMFNHDILPGDLPEKESAEAMRIPLRKPLINDSMSRTPTSLEKIEHILPANFFVTEVQSVPPSPNRWKSLSMGVAWRRWGLRDLVFRRSCSDRKEKLGYVAAKKTKAVKCSHGRDAAKGGLDIVTAHRLYYSKNGGAIQRSFLPYKRDLVGFFTGGQRRRP